MPELHFYRCDLCRYEGRDRTYFSNRVDVLLRERPPGKSGGEISVSAILTWTAGNVETAVLCKECVGDLRASLFDALDALYHAS